MGAKVIRQLAVDLRREFPDVTGLSATDLQYMRAFVVAWPSEPISPQRVGTLPGGHVRVLLDQLDDPVLRSGAPPATPATAGPVRCMEHHIATGGLNLQGPRAGGGALL